MSWIIEELPDTIGHQQTNTLYFVNVPKYALACARYNRKDYQFSNDFE
jgi:hypothetical protein